MKYKILLIGKNGQVGAELERLLPELGEVFALGREELDLTKAQEIRNAVRTTKPNLIVNAAAYTAVDRAETDRSVANAVNAEAPAVLAEEAGKQAAAIVHYSTDYVFDGTGKLPYEETDPTHPVNFYGETKLKGERAVTSSGVPYLVFRVEWIYGSRGRNFLLTMLRLAAEREELRIVSDQVGSPTWSREIARATTRALKRVLESGPDSLAAMSGTYNMTAAGKASWHEFAKAIIEEARSSDPQPEWLLAVLKGDDLRVRSVAAISTAEFPTPARRPAYSVLSSARFQAQFGFILPDWRDQLRSLFAGN